jgi:hypothetical protein
MIDWNRFPLCLGCGKPVPPQMLSFRYSLEYYTHASKYCDRQGRCVNTMSPARAIEEAETILREARKQR